MRFMKTCRAAVVTVVTTGAVLLAACSEEGPPTAATVAAIEVPAEASAARAFAAPAATISFETRVAGYSRSGDNGWITVSASCGGGGRVVRGGRRDACTDRVSRGEELRVRIDSRGAHRTEALGIAGVSSSNGFFRGALIPVPFSAVFRVSTDPTFDNVHVSVRLFDAQLRPLGDVQSRRVPIGRRP